MIIKMNDVESICKFSEYLLYTVNGMRNGDIPMDSEREQNCLNSLRRLNEIINEIERTWNGFESNANLSATQIAYVVRIRIWYTDMCTMGNGVVVH